MVLCCDVAQSFRSTELTVSKLYGPVDMYISLHILLLNPGLLSCVLLALFWLCRRPVGCCSGFPSLDVEERRHGVWMALQSVTKSENMGQFEAGCAGCARVVVITELVVLQPKLEILDASGRRDSIKSWYFTWARCGAVGATGGTSRNPRLYVRTGGYLPINWPYISPRERPKTARHCDCSLPDRGRTMNCFTDPKPFQQSRQWPTWRQ